MTEKDLGAETMPEGSEFLRVAGLRVDEVGGGKVRSSIELGEHHHTPWGVVHGGVYTTAVESAASMGASSTVEDKGKFAVGGEQQHRLLAADEGGASRSHRRAGDPRQEPRAPFRLRPRPPSPRRPFSSPPCPRPRPLLLATLRSNPRRRLSSKRDRAPLGVLLPRGAPSLSGVLDPVRWSACHGSELPRERLT